MKQTWQRIGRTLLALAMSFVLCLSMATSAFAITTNDCGLTVTKNKSYYKDDKFIMSFNITGGRGYNNAEGSTFVKAKLLNSNGKQVLSWKESEIPEDVKKTKSFAINQSLASDTYIFVLMCRTYGREYGAYGSWRNNSFEWKYSIKHTQPSSLKFKGVEEVLQDDDWKYEIAFTHGGSKGKYINIEIYDEYGTKVWGKRASKAISSSGGTFNFIWNGYPTGGGMQCKSGDYTIKYWLEGKDPKQVKVTLLSLN